MKQRGFTLLELLVVLGLVAATSFLLAGAVGGGNRTARLRSSQTMLASLVTAARTKAAATGHRTRLLVHIDPDEPSRYLRFVVLQFGRQPGTSPTDWITLQPAYLPAGVFVAPGSLTGLVADPALWKRESDASSALASDLFANQSLAYALEGDASASVWTGITFTPSGTLAALSGGPPPKGSLVISLGEARPPGTFGVGQSPVQLIEPTQVCGLLLSAYGVPALLPDRHAF